MRRHRAHLPTRGTPVADASAHARRRFPRVGRSVVLIRPNEQGDADVGMQGSNEVRTPIRQGDWKLITSHDGKRVLSTIRLDIAKANHLVDSGSLDDGDVVEKDRPAAAGVTTDDSDVVDARAGFELDLQRVIGL